VVLALRAFVHPPRRIRRLLDCTSLEEQRRFLAAEWNNRRFRLLYRLLLSRTALAQGLDPRCLAQTPERRPDRVFLRLFERAMETLPVGENYFLHEMLTGRYPASACPPYLSRDGAALLARGGGGLTLVDGGFTDFLRTQPARSLDGFALSNVCEWLAPADVQLLFAEVRRTARPGAVVVFRNFVGWTEVPAQLAAEIVEDRPRGEALIARDRSLLQRRIAVCRVRPAPAVGPSGSVRVREARAADNAALLRLAAGCPMEGDLTLCIERAPDFFALTHVEGDRTRLRVAESPGGLVGCVALAERTSHLDGRPARTLYAGDLKVAAPWRGQGVADALVADICELACRRGDAETPVLLTVLAGNHNMERRLDGPRGLPPLTRLATVRSLALPALRRRQRVEPWRIRAARPADVEAMLALWGRVAPQRQFAPVHWTPEAFVRRSESLPGFGLSAYRLAHDGAGRLQGFLGVWEQSSLKQLRVVADSPRLARSRRALQLLGPVLGLPPLPHAGQILRCATVFGLCVPSDQPGVLHALLRRALHELRAAGIGVLNLALDVRDPLLAGSRGLFAQPTLIHAYVCRPAGRWQGAPLDGRPLHLETALA
jgi:GNAT superfamily N-acetyltransferase